jgi:hypothetical protein
VNAKSIPFAKMILTSYKVASPVSPWTGYKPTILLTQCWICQLTAQEFPHLPASVRLKTCVLSIDRVNAASFARTRIPVRSVSDKMGRNHPPAAHRNMTDSTSLS